VGGQSGRSQRDGCHLILGETVLARRLFDTLRQGLHRGCDSGNDPREVLAHELGRALAESP